MTTMAAAIEVISPADGSLYVRRDYATSAEIDRVLGDAVAAQRIGGAVETGTLFMNRCDYLDPALAWTGVKNSGRGCTLSKVGYDALTRPKSYNLRTV